VKTLSGLLNEPIKGQGVFWSSEGGTPYPLPIRVLSFEHLFKTLDPHYNKTAVDTYAKELKKKFDEMLKKAIKVDHSNTTSDIGTDAISASAESDQVTDPKEIYESSAIEALKIDKKLMDAIKGEGAAYGAIKAFLLSKLPAELENRDEIAYALVPKALNTIFGLQDQEWHSFRNPQRDNKTYVKTGKKLS